jgi:hypothetical protein
LNGGSGGVVGSELILRMGQLKAVAAVFTVSRAHQIVATEHVLLGLLVVVVVLLSSRRLLVVTTEMATKVGLLLLLLVVIQARVEVRVGAIRVEGGLVLLLGVRVGRIVGRRSGGG